MTVGSFPGDSPERRLAIHLVVMGFAEVTVRKISPGPFSTQYLDEARLGPASLDVIKRNLSSSQVELAITHAGAVRRAELEQQLQTGRIKEPMGLIWDGRHFRRDTRIALLDVTDERPLVVVYLDLNDVKAFNAKGHATGDAAIRRYLEMVADIAADRSDAYRSPAAPMRW